jgi:hypothetical protein
VTRPFAHEITAGDFAFAAGHLAIGFVAGSGFCAIQQGSVKALSPKTRE